MTRSWTVTLIAVVATAAMACGRSDRAPDRDATQGSTGTTGQGAGEETITGCLALGQMGTYMLTPEEALPSAGGLGRGAATTGYQLLGDPDDFNQYMNKRVRVTGTRADSMRQRPDSNAAPGAGEEARDRAPWPQLQVREVDLIGGDCQKR